MEKTRSKFRLLLTVCMLAVLIVVAINSGKAEAASAKSGSLTSTITYSFDSSTGELSITGEGEMPDCLTASGAVDEEAIPWWSY